jgi:hypothetical protein
MVNNKVYPHESESNKLHDNSTKKRIKNIGKWLLAIAGFPLAYIILPVSCCIRNPAVNAFDEREETPVNASEKMGENLAIGFVGVAATITCGCCFGMCGSKSPSEML